MYVCLSLDLSKNTITYLKKKKKQLSPKGAGECDSCNSGLSRKSKTLSSNPSAAKEE
jgi:hypothetical protein